MARLPERAVTIPLADGQLVLEGILAGPARPDADGAVIAAPHPLFGGSMDSPVVNEIGYACQRVGITSLRFNWRGAGGSGGQASGEAADADADYGAALAEVGETVSGRIAACGYSFGAAAAVRVGARHERVDRLLLVAPPLGPREREALASFAGEVLVIVGEADALVPPQELESMAASLARCSCAVVPDADHYFVTGLGEVGRAAFDWLGSRRGG